jgi:WD40 repeat protein
MRSVETRIIKALSFSGDGRTLASAGIGDAVTLWDVGDGGELTRFRGHMWSCITSIAFSPDDRIVASASIDGTVRLWDVNSETTLAVLRGHRGLVMTVAFSPDGQTLASAGDDEIVRVWDVALAIEGKAGQFRRADGCSANK